MLALHLTVQPGHRHRDHRRILLDLANTCLCQTVEQRLRITLQMRFEIAKRPVRQVIEQRRNLGKESLAVTS